MPKYLFTMFSGDTRTIEVTLPNDKAAERFRDDVDLNGEDEEVPWTEGECLTEVSFTRVPKARKAPKSTALRPWVVKWVTPKDDDHTIIAVVLAVSKRSALTKGLDFIADPKTGFFPDAETYGGRGWDAGAKFVVAPIRTHEACVIFLKNALHVEGLRSAEQRKAASVANEAQFLSHFIQ